MSDFLKIFVHDLKLATRRGGGAFNIIAFFVIAATLFPFGIGAQDEVLKNTGVGIIWVCALLSSMLALGKLYDDDYEDGTLAQLVLTGKMPEVVVFAKICAHWVANIVPLIITVPFVAVFFHIEDMSLDVILMLLLGTPTILLIGSIGASLTLGIKRGGGLLAVLVLPLYIPVLIFGVLGEYSILFALLLFMLPVALYSSAAAIKLALEE